MTNSCNFDTSVGGDGSTVTDDANASTGLDGGYHALHFVPALSQLVAIALWVKNRALDMIGYATAASDSADDAAQSAIDAAAAVGSSISGTDNTTSVAIGAGTKSFTVQAGRSFFNGQQLQAFHNTSNYMVGTCSAYNSTTGAISIVVPASSFQGSGSYSTWTIGAAPRDYITPAYILSRRFS